MHSDSSAKIIFVFPSKMLSYIYLLISASKESRIARQTVAIEHHPYKQNSLTENHGRNPIFIRDRNTQIRAAHQLSPASKSADDTR